MAMHDVVAERKTMLPSRVYQLYLLAGTRMMELLMSAANKDLRDEDMRGKWQDKYQKYVHDYYGKQLDGVCVKHPDWFTCTRNGGKPFSCPTDYLDANQVKFTLNSDAPSQNAFNDYINSTLGLTRDLIKLDTQRTRTEQQYFPPGGIFRRQEQQALVPVNSKLNARALGVHVGGGFSRPKIIKTIGPGIVSEYPPKMGIVLTNFTENARVSLKEMQGVLASGNTNTTQLYQAVVQVIVRTQSGNDTLNQFYAYKDWVEQQKELENFLKSFFLEIIIGTMLGGIIDIAVGVLEVAAVAARAISAARTVVGIISRASKAFDSLAELSSVKGVMKIASQGIKFNKQFFHKTWGVLPKRVQTLFERLAPKLDKVKNILQGVGCDKLGEFVGFQIPNTATSESSKVHLDGFQKKPALVKRSAPSQDDCIFGLTSTKQIRGINSNSDYAYCYCYHSTTAPNSGPNNQVTCPNGKKLLTKYLAPNSLFNLGGYEKVNTQATCDHVWELGELVAFTAVKDKSKASAMCKRISEVAPDFNRKVRTLINGPRNLQVVSNGIDSLKHQVFTGNVSTAVFKDPSRFRALQTYMNGKSQAFSDVKTSLGAYFGELEAAEAKAVAQNRYFSGIKKRFNAFFDDGMSRRSELMGLVDGIIKMKPGPDKDYHIQGVDGYMYSGFGNHSSFSGDILSQSAGKGLSALCKKL
ncbi:hypothetical protein GGI12_001992 [Dipsacomyces acuminosporus]|nr:hypothetical protein GGI12_001992 [Dipsacomyces acuminosporus]